MEMNARTHDPARRRGLALGGCALLLALGYVACGPRKPAERDLGRFSVPDLRMPATECSAPRSGAIRRAEEAALAAAAKVSRYPYAPNEGLAALALLVEAERCHALAADPIAAAAARARAAGWHSKLASDFRDHLVRYRIALAADRRAQARSEVAFLLALLAHESPEFTSALRNEQRELEENAKEKDR
jgi:hypothetical protein